MSADSTGAQSTTDLAEQRTGLAGNRTRWAADRTFWAADRTLIAWLRTSISLIGFGFTIGKAGDALESQGIILDRYHSLQVIGVMFISLAVLGLIGAVIQDFRFERRIRAQGYGRAEPTPLGLVMAILVLLGGILGAVVIFL
jgi:putative membrane protein